uniref:Retrovirus-related Pol polyprotein from transposon TNT 1-94 n=1 Tax=Cajanus cajan TaxID=3821 RepID=A0A151SED8_CAJCA|nr:Retrovirus-related Pol polyprotein from transposon TNT 1-94 [Cajanus cajan]
MDVHNAFLHGDLDEEVYMNLSPGFQSPLPGKVCHLRKSLYGLQQAPQQWFTKLFITLKHFGFKQSYVDYLLFSYIKREVSLHVLIYVDDLIIVGFSHDAVVKFKQYLSDCFHVKDFGALKYFLGLEVARSLDGLLFSQRKYSLVFISKAGLLGAKLVAPLMEQNHNLARSEGELYSKLERYRQLVGHLIYLRITRPKLSYSIQILAQFMGAPLFDH